MLWVLHCRMQYWDGEGTFVDDGIYQVSINIVSIMCSLWEKRTVPTNKTKTKVFSGAYRTIWKNRSFSKGYWNAERKLRVAWHIFRGYAGSLIKWQNIFSNLLLCVTKKALMLAFGRFVWQGNFYKIYTTFLVSGCFKSQFELIPCLNETP